MNAAFVSAIFLSLVPATGSSALEIKPPTGARAVFTETGNEYQQNSAFDLGNAVVSSKPDSLKW